MEIKVRVEQTKHNIDLKLKDNIVVYRESGREPQNKAVEFIENGEYLVQPDDGYILENVNIKVDVPIPEGYIKPEGTKDITNTEEIDVYNYAKAQIKDDNLKAENIAEGVNVLGIEGTFKGGADTSDATITPDKVLKDEIGYGKDGEKVVGAIETWDGIIDGEYKLYNSLNDYLLGTKTKITARDLEGFTELRLYAFAYSPITAVEFPEQLVRLGDRAFYQTKITSINLEGISYVGQYTFSYTPIKELVLPSSIKGYGQRCFESCTELETVRIESSATFAPHMFQYDTKLKRVICLLETPPNIYADQFKQFKGGETIEVRADLVEKYKSATNWSNYADYIIAYEGD